MSPAEEAQVVAALEETSKAAAEIGWQRLVIAALVEAASQAASILERHHNETGNHVRGDNSGHLRAAIKLAGDSDPRNEVAS